MSIKAMSGHGTIIAYEQTAGAAFTDIAELRDITIPEMMRNEFDATTQSEDIDSYALGVLRRGPVTFSLNFLPKDATHDHLTGLYKHLIDNVLAGYRITPPGASPHVYIMSGQVQAISPTAPVDGLLAADVTLRMSGAMSIGGVDID